jgi:NTE family protein
MKVDDMKKLLIRFITPVVCLVIFCSCATYQPNPRLEKAEDLNSIRLTTFKSKDRSDELFLVLTFSGGGTRAAAMSYGILEALAKVKIPQKNEIEKSGNSGHSLLDEVDMISSVSGGSFTAAYYGLHGKKAFDDYTERFLYQRVQSALMWRVFNPFLWPKLFSSGYNRSILAADYYDKILFDGKSMGDLRNSDGPAILIQATDIIDGYNFSFTPYFFNLICSSLNDFSVSQAVAASSAFPGAFSGISLTNYAGQCGYQSEPWVYEAIQKKKSTDILNLFAKRELVYTDSEDKKYVHLYDGGVSDNLGLEGPLIDLAQFIERGVDLRELGLENTRRVVFIIVNAQTNMNEDRKYLNVVPKPPRARRSASAALTTLMNSSNFDTIFIFQKYLEEKLLKKQLAGKDTSHVDHEIIHISFGEITDEEEREFFENLPTSLQLPQEKVDRVREKAGELLYQSEEFRRLIKDLQELPPSTNM